MSEELKVKGIIRSIGEIKEFGSKGFKSVKWSLEMPDGEYPQTVEFESTQKNAEGFVKFNKVGDSVDVKFNLRGRVWNDPKTGEDKVFNSLNAWMVSKDAVQQPVGNLAPAGITPADEGLDLPF